MSLIPLSTGSPCFGSAATLQDPEPYVRRQSQSIDYAVAGLRGVFRFVWLPRQAPELSPMDQLWRDLKRLIAANRQAASIDALAADAADWVLTLTPQQARRKAGMASKHFWLRKLLQNFWRPT